MKKTIKRMIMAVLTVMIIMLMGCGSTVKAQGSTIHAETTAIAIGK